jgi:hypothetical protein
MVAASTKQPGHKDLRVVLARTSGIKTRAQSVTWLALVPVPDARPRAATDPGQAEALCFVLQRLDRQLSPTEDQGNKDLRQRKTGIAGRSLRVPAGAEDNGSRNWSAPGERNCCAEKTSDRKTNTRQQNQVRN